MWFLLGFLTMTCLLLSTIFFPFFSCILPGRQIFQLELQIHLDQSEQESFTSDWMKAWQKVIEKQLWCEIHLSYLLMHLFIFRKALRSLCSCHWLNSQLLCLLYQTHKVALFHCCMSITHGNRISFVSVAATSVNKLRQVKLKGKVLANRLKGFSDLNHWACPSS